MSEIELTGEVVGAASVAGQLGRASLAAREGVRRTVTRLGLEVLTHVKEDYLSGRALHVRTGRLRRSINERTTDAGDAITSSVGTNVVYGRTWEIGFSGMETVRAHMRRVARTGAMSQVRSFSRQVHKGPRPFLRPALADAQARIVASLNEALAEAARGV